MNDILDEFQFENKNKYKYNSERINSKNFFWMFFPEPRLAFNYILANEPKRYLPVFFGFYVVYAAIEGGYAEMFPFEILSDNSILKILFDVFCHSFFSIFTIYILRAIGQSFNGSADMKELITVYGWSLLPLLIFVPFDLIERIIVDFNLELPDYFYDSEIIAFFRIIINLGTFFSVVWYIILMIVGLAAANKVSNIKAFLIFLISSVLVIIPLLILSVYLFPELYY